MASAAHGFLFGFAFDAAGAREFSGLEEAAAPPRAGEHFRWIHLDWRADEAGRWLRERSGLDPAAASAAVVPKARQMAAHYGDTLLVVLRTPNLNEGADPEDLVSLRMLMIPRLLVTVRRLRVRAADEVAKEVRQGLACATPVDVMSRLLGQMVGQLQALVEEIGERLDDFENRVANPRESPERAEIADLRRQVIVLRKFLTPQRDALQRLVADASPLLGEDAREQLRDPAMRTARQVEELEAARERAAVLMEEMSVQSTEELNRRIYVFTVIAGIFLPLTFLAGALGMNVGGIPLSASPRGFWLILGVMGAAGVGIWLLLRRQRWL